MWQWSWWKDTVERAVSVMAATAAALLGAGGIGVLDVDWLGLVSVAGMAGLVSVLQSIGSLRVGTLGTASVLTLPQEPTGVQAHPFVQKRSLPFD